MADREYIKYRTFIYMENEHKIEIYNEDRIKKAEGDGLLENIIYLDDDAFNKLVKELEPYNIKEWKDQYINNQVLDGMEWELSYNINGRKRTIFGMNDYPTNWKKVDEIIKDIADHYGVNKLLFEDE